MSGGWKESEVGKMERVAGGAETSKPLLPCKVCGLESNEH